MSPIVKVAVFGASGNFGAPITAALIAAGFQVTAISRTESSSIFPVGVSVAKTDYTVEKLTEVLTGKDAAVCVLGPAGLAATAAITDAAEAAGVKRFILNDFGWGPDFRSEPEFSEIGKSRQTAWNRAKALAEKNPSFTWTGITIGNPIDWALRRFSLMGFDVKQRSAIIYDDGTEEFTGTTLEGIGQAVVGVFQNPEATANRFVKARSIQASQNQLLEAFQNATGQTWQVRRRTTKELQESGRKKHSEGTGGWVLDLLVFQLFEPGKGRCVVASRAESDADLLGIQEESAAQVVAKALK